MICGAGNFPVRKKEKQIKAFEANRENWRKAEHYLDQLKRAHTLIPKCWTSCGPSWQVWKPDTN